MTRLQGGISGVGQRRPRITRNWQAAREKVDLEGCCRVCGTTFRIEAAHVVAREHDASFPVRNEDWSPYDVAPDRIIPLCGPATDTTTCHGKQHAKTLDLLTHLTEPEQVQAVADAGSISTAYTLLMPSESPKRTARAA